MKTVSTSDNQTPLTSTNNTTSLLNTLKESFTAFNPLNKRKEPGIPPQQESLTTNEDEAQICAADLLTQLSTWPTSNAKLPSTEKAEQPAKKQKLEEIKNVRNKYHILFPEKKEYLERVKALASTPEAEQNVTKSLLLKEQVLYKVPQAKVREILTGSFRFNIENLTYIKDKPSFDLAFFIIQDSNELIQVTSAFAKHAKKMRKKGQDIETHAQMPFMLIIGDVEAFGKSYHKAFALDYVEEVSPTKEMVLRPERIQFLSSKADIASASNNMSAPASTEYGTKEALTDYIANITAITEITNGRDKVACYQSSFTDTSLQWKLLVRLPQGGAHVKSDRNALFMTTTTLLKLAKEHQLTDILAEKVTSVCLQQQKTQQQGQFSVIKL